MTRQIGFRASAEETRRVRWILAALLSLPLAARASDPKSNASVTVWYEATDVIRADGTKGQKEAKVPWAKNLTLLRAIAAAGGYSTPPDRYIYLARNGRSTLLPDPGKASSPANDLWLQPGDRIEIRSTQPPPANRTRR